MVDRNVEIIAALASLRCLSDIFKEDDQLHHSLGQTIHTIIGIIHDAHNGHHMTSHLIGGEEDNSM